MHFLLDRLLFCVIALAGHQLFTRLNAQGA